MLEILLFGVIGFIALKLAIKVLFKGIKVVLILAVLYIVATQFLGVEGNISTDILGNIFAVL